LFKENDDIELNNKKKNKKKKRKIDAIETEQEIETPIKSETSLQFSSNFEQKNLF